MNLFTRIFLVLLRLAVGWHFFVEGLEKYHSFEIGPTTTNRPWTSENYLRESTGPLGDFYRNKIGDTDETALDLLTAQGEPAGGDPSPRARFPRALAKQWDAYRDRFVRHNEVNEGRRRNAVDKTFDYCKDRTAIWLLSGKIVVKANLASGPVEREVPVAERIDEYRVSLRRLHNVRYKEMPAMGSKAAQDKYRDAKAETVRLRTELMSALNEQTDFMKNQLQSLAWLQCITAATMLPNPGAPTALAITGLSDKEMGQYLFEAAPMTNPPAEKAENPTVARIDRMTMWGLIAVGACLLVGFFTRTACVAGAVFLLMVYLSMPPWPWLPANPIVEGHYLFVNKNLIEMLALLVLATTRTGRWAGLDGLLRLLNPKRWRRPKEKG